MLLYRILYIPALVLALPYFAYRMWRRGGYRKGFANRFGILEGVPPRKPGIRRIWIQAVSVGELMAIGPLLRNLLAEKDTEIVLTTTTSTGYRLLNDKYSEETVWRGTFPLDFWACSRKAWKLLQPDMAVLMEGELWPEHIHQAYLRKVPVVMINARLSDRSFRRHYKVRSFMRSYLCKLSAILAGSTTDLKRIRKLGWLPEERILRSGNLKLDLDQEPDFPTEERKRLLSELGFANLSDESTDIQVLLGSSTWPGEEAALVQSYIDLRKRFPNLRLLIVPRHAERRKELEADLKALPVQTHYRTDRKQAPPGTEVYVADTTGELKSLTRVADLVFIGKSLPPNSGGQTPIEAASMGKAIICGPQMNNFRDVTRSLLRENAIVRLQSVEELTAQVARFLENPDERLAMGQRAGAFIDVSRGAADFTAATLLELLNQQD
ncbi:3-deoxy-D-manno-octulosonic acid transferase [Puniceicoccales bacterium CK1056]|uniref:3-deoxy-D-manno-octulosonic acid transferase n=1 Tax=Oceanipulchritudo coccoides TaxID=2706888 RepID=A0A6B2LZ07_9BACT|nr:glycosyltransferase N-terminal domain-containing protein [Oceanipulchritudo coccoides]NDV61868.1 3-deoxy-D-manno-octulosonic acid transferase [Oceanipulchritudo coccoides]